MIEKYLLLLHTLHPPPFTRPSSTQTHSQVLRHFTDSGLYTDLFVITLVIKQIGLPLRGHPTRVQTEFEPTRSHTIINRTPLSPVLTITYQLPNTINPL